MENQELIIICTLGRGGSGKDTQVELFTEEKLRDGKINPNYLERSVKISTGDIIRRAQIPGDSLYDKYYEELKPYIEGSNLGGLIPDELVLKLAEQEIAYLYLGGKRVFFFTGFPRTEKQMNSFCQWMNILRRDGVWVKSLFVNFEVSEEISRERAKARREKAEKNRGKIRRDDKEEVVEKRLRTFRESTEPMLDELFKQNRLVVVKSDRSIEAIFGDFKSEVAKIVESKII